MKISAFPLQVLFLLIGIASFAQNEATTFDVYESHGWKRNTFPGRHYHEADKLVTISTVTIDDLGVASCYYMAGRAVDLSALSPGLYVLRMSDTRKSILIVKS